MGGEQSEGARPGGAESLSTCGTEPGLGRAPRDARPARERYAAAEKAAFLRAVQ